MRDNRHGWPDDNDLKRCGKCERWLFASAFGRDTRIKDGRKTICTKCSCATERERKKNKPSHFVQGSDGFIRDDDPITCRACLKELNGSFFGLDVRLRGGRKHECRECVSIYALSVRRKKADMMSSDADDLRKCIACDRWLLGSLFRPDRRIVGGEGRSLVCQECESSVPTGHKVCQRCARVVPINLFMNGLAKHTVCHGCRNDEAMDKRAEEARLTLVRGTKKCTKCKEDLPLAKFIHLERSPDGYASSCVACLDHGGVTDDDVRFLERRRIRHEAFEKRTQEARLRQAADAMYVGLLGTDIFGDEIRENEIPSYARERVNKALVAMYLDQGRPDLAEQARVMVVKYDQSGARDGQEAGDQTVLRDQRPDQ